MTASGTAVHPAGGRAGSARRRSAPRRRPAARRRRRTATDVGRWLPIVLVALAVLAGLAWDTRATAGPDGCTMAGVPLTAEQLANAATIAEVGRERGLPDRAVVIALATAQQESRLRNLDHGDRDSLGLFQQRPSQGWGTEAQVQDPVYAAGIFYDRLVQVPGWDTGELTVVAQAVQRSGFPDAYAQWQPMAEALTASMAASRPATPDCG
jgi:hypothetical protein